MSLINDIYNGNNIDLGKAESNKLLQPYIEKLQECGFHALWHNEKSAYEHSILVYKEMEKYCNENDINGNERLILLLSAYLHDIGKSASGVLKEDGNWSFPNHALKSQYICRFLLWNEPFEIREAICWFVGNHMRPYFIIDSSHSERDLIGISYSCPYLPTITTMKNLYVLKQCDFNGSIKTATDDFEERIAFFKNKCEELDIWVNKPLESKALYAKNGFDYFKYFNENNHEVIPINHYNDTLFNVYIMIGISGSGKSTYISSNQTLKDLPIISRDKTRYELKFIKNIDDKVKLDRKKEDVVTNYNNKLMHNLMLEHKSFIIDDMNLLKKWRKGFSDEIRKRKGAIHFIYIEASTSDILYERRKENNVTRETIDKMIKRLDFPIPNESMSFLVIKDNNIIYNNSL